MAYKQRGWEATTTPADFARYTKFTVEKLEKNLNISAPSMKQIWGANCCNHEKVYDAGDGAESKRIGHKSGEGDVQVGIDLEKMMPLMVAQPLRICRFRC